MQLKPTTAQTQLHCQTLPLFQHASAVVSATVWDGLSLKVFKKAFHRGIISVHSSPKDKGAPFQQSSWAIVVVVLGDWSIWVA